MKTIEKTDFRPYFQGDVMIMRIKRGSTPAKTRKLDTEVIAHSETGHHHVARYADVFGGLDPMVMFLKAKGDKVEIAHLRDFDTHETYQFYSDPGDEFIIKRQRERAPEGWRRIED